MKKIFKTSVVTSFAIMGLTSSLFGADNLSEAFKNGKVKGQLKSYYYSKNYDSSTVLDADIFVNGATLGFVTDWLNGFRVGATFQTSHVTSIDDNSKKYRTTMDASGSVLSESYIQYRNKELNTDIKAGRQFIWSPLIAASPTRFIKQSFEAYVITNKSLPKTDVIVTYVDKLQSRTDGNGGVAKFEQAATNGAYSLYIKNKSIKDLALRAQLIDVRKEYKTLYADALYKYATPLKPYIGVRYFGTNYDDSSEKSSYSIGFKAGITIADVNLFSSYSQTSKDNNVERGLGFAVAGHYASRAVSIAAASFKADATEYQIGAGYKFGKLSTKLFYTKIDLPQNGFGIFDSDLKETTFNLGYKFGGDLKGLAFNVEYALIDSGAANQEENALWTKLVYSF